MFRKKELKESQKELKKITSEMNEINIDVLMKSIREQAKSITELNDEKEQITNKIIDDLREIGSCLSEREKDKLVNKKLHEWINLKEEEGWD